MFVFYSHCDIFCSFTITLHLRLMQDVTHSLAALFLITFNNDLLSYMSVFCDLIRNIYWKQPEVSGFIQLHAQTSQFHTIITAPAYF